MRAHILSALICSTAAWSAPAENLLRESSFEQPAVAGRTPETDAGLLPVDNQNCPWSFFGASPETDGGTIVVGITDEIARTGKQSIYVDFQKVTANGRFAALISKLIPIKPSQAYRLSMWGRIDRKRPLALDERRPFMVVDVEFFAADQKSKAGEPIRGFQLIPGRVIPGGPHPLIYMAKKWSESSSQFTAPEGAAFLKVSWKWQVPTDPGETDGVIYWDDATLVEDNSPPVQNEPAKGDGALTTDPTGAAISEEKK